MQRMQKPADYQDPKTVEVLFSAEKIAARLDSLAEEIVRSIGKEFMIVGLLRGSFVFTADLIRALYRHGAEPQIDFMTLSSYGEGTSSSGKVVVGRDIADDVKGRQVLIVDDILETGRTLSFALALLKERGADMTIFSPRAFAPAMTLSRICSGVSPTRSGFLLPSTPFGALPASSICDAKGIHTML